MQTVIQTGGKQYLIKEGQTLKVERLSGAEVGKIVNLENVLLVSGDDGRDLVLGSPFVPEAKVEARVIEHGKGKKVVVRKFKAKTRYSRTYGHRQPYSKITITSIDIK